MKLYYFAAPGRAETSRILLHYGGIAFEDVRFEPAKWPELKPKMPFGQVPVLELEDGTMIAQSAAIDGYIARKVGLSPEDSLEIARCDEIAGILEECAQAFTSTYAIQDLQEKIAARKKIAATTLHAKFESLEKLLGQKEFFVGGKLTYADIKVFSMIGGLVCGFLDGLDKSIYDDFTALKAFHKRIASVPAIKAYYDNETDIFRKSFKTDFFDH